jgi:methionine-rich copper-binding protein CopC
MDINLTGGDDVYSQPLERVDEWNGYFGLQGNDTIRLYQGYADGGPGNDRIERVSVPDQPWRDNVQVGFRNASTAVTVNLEEGWALDGEGGRDTLVGVLSAHGTQWNDWFKGNSGDNYFWVNGGKDTVIGGLGRDGVTLPGFEPAPGLPWRQPTPDELLISLSADGRQATIRPKNGTGFELQLTDVEYFDTPINGVWTQFNLLEYLTQATMATQAVAAGGNLRWNSGQALGTPTAVTFSFVTSAPGSGLGSPGFRPFTAAEQQLVRDILAKTSAVSGLSFTEVVESGSAQGQIRFGVSQQAATKGVSWLPGQSGADSQAGDIWMDVESMLNLRVGSEGYAALLHEIGHALGLRHPRNVDASDAWPMQLRAVDDRTALTVMSQNASADGLHRADWGTMDVLALRYLYGTKPLATGDSVYALGSERTAGQTLIVDDGGNDTIDASAFNVGVSINLAAGKMSSVGLTADGRSGVENLAILETSVIENAIGTSRDDVLVGNEANNRLTGGLGNDWLDGGNGTDTAVFTGRLSEYRIFNSVGQVFVEAKDGVSGFDTLIGIEKLSFQDQTIDTDTVTIQGEVRQGQTLRAVVTLAQPQTAGTFSYQWRHNGNDLKDATGATFTPRQSEVGGQLSVIVRYTDVTGFASSLTSPAGSAVQNTNDRPTGYVRIEGTGEVGQKLRAVYSIEDPDGYGGVYFEWRRDGIDIRNSNSQEYTIQQDDLGSVITVAVMYGDWGGINDGMVSSNSVTVAPPRNPTAEDTTPPSISILADRVSLASGEATVISFTLSEASTNFTVGDIAFSGGDVTAFTGSGREYTAVFTPSPDTEGKAILSVASAAFTDAAGNANGDGAESNNRISLAVDTLAPTFRSFSPADGAKGVSVGATLAFTFSEAIQLGSGSITLKTASGQVVETFAPTRISLQGDTLVLSPARDFGVFTNYKVDFGAGAIEDLKGNDLAPHGSYDFRTATQDALYHFFVVAFAAAPGVTYMAQLAEAVNFGLSVAQIVEVFTTKTQFTSVYPATMSNRELATQLVNNIVKNSASVAIKQAAIDDIDGALGSGWSRGKMLYTVFGNLASKPLTDPTWGSTAKQFQNQLAVARYFTEEMGVATENLATLRGVIGSVTPDTDVSTTDKIVQIIGTVPPGG